MKICNIKNTVNVIDYLFERDLIAQITNRDKLHAMLQSRSISLYCGFDPTADSLHIGHLVPLLCLKKFQMFGHRPIILLGGATGLIGDPSFKDTERHIRSYDVIQKWIKKIKVQISLLINFDETHGLEKPCIIINNNTWFSSMNVLTFLKDIGKFFSVNKMINKDIIKKRLKKNNHGISYTEFSYNLMQSYDFAYLYKNYGVVLQIGGSDQWGNIISGIDLVKRMHQYNTYGLTVPLLTNFNNIKFGKTEKHTVWLDPKKTSPYKFYQYWVSVDDRQVHSFLKIFTDIDLEKINSFYNNENNFNQSFIAKSQVILAENMTKLIHGEKGLKSAKRITNNLFYDNVLDLTVDDFRQLAQDGIPTIISQKNINLQQALVESGLAVSKSQARYFIKSNAVTVNKNKQLKTEYVFNDSDRLYNRYTLLKKGKKHYCLIQWK